MSFLKNIKGTLQDVQQDITSSIRNLRSKEKKSEQHISTISKAVDLDAGADLLDRFQSKWIEIHEYSEASAKKAHSVDKQVTNFCGQYEHCYNMINQLNTEVRAVPQLVGDIHGVMEKIGNLESLFSDIEAALLELEDTIEAQDLASNKRQHEKQLASYTKRRNVELEVVKVHQANEHARKVEEFESHIQEHIQQRGQVLEDVSTEELQQYKLYGVKPTKVSPGSPEKDRPVNLADIQLDQDCSDLNKFLATEDVNDNTTTDFVKEESDDDIEDGSKEVILTTDDDPKSVITMVTKDTEDEPS